MPLYCCYQSLCMRCLEELLKFGWVVLCLCWEDQLVGLVPSLARRKRRKSRIRNVVPGPRPRLGSFVVKHWRLLWLYSVGADQATNLNKSLLSQSVGNGRRDPKLDSSQSCQTYTLAHLPAFVRDIMIFFVCQS